MYFCVISDHVAAFVTGKYDTKKLISKVQTAWWHLYENLLPKKHLGNEGNTGHDIFRGSITICSHHPC
jgi:hypothetical protein